MIFIILLKPTTEAFSFIWTERCPLRGTLGKYACVRYFSYNWDRIPDRSSFRGAVHHGSESIMEQFHAGRSVWQEHANLVAVYREAENSRLGSGSVITFKAYSQ